jgi:3-oxoacyl-[acyl-carrier protein] reductase
MNQLTGKTAVVTGGGRGIGRAIALRFAAEGAHVITGDILADRADEVAREIREAGGEASGAPLDVTNPEQVANFFARIPEPDILVNVAGVGLTKLFLETTVEEWQRVLAVNLTGTFLCSQHAARGMAARRSGKIINIASLSGQRAGTGRAAYGASKAGVTMLTKVMAVELAPYGITVNEIAPGPVNTEMTAVTHDQATRQAYHNLIPMRRYAERDEIAAAAVFLASREADFVNGHTLNVDGGFGAAGLMFDLKE